MTRTQNSFFNMVTGLGSELLLVVMNFITRRIFIQTLGSSYLGIEGYFTNILSILSLTNLGFGTAIVFKLYKPIEEKDQRRIQVLMRLYREVYFVVGCIIGGLGLILIPFLPRLVRDYGRLASLGLNGVFIFLLYLSKTVSSYWFFAYKNAFIRATQKGYLLTIVGYAVSIADCIAQILILVFTGNFVLYLVTQILFVILKNIINAIVCDRRHPYLREKITERVSRAEVIGIFKDCTATLLHQISGTVMRSSDNVVLGAMVGLGPVGLYANYLMIESNLSSLLNSVINATEASLGSLHSTNHLDWSRLCFRVVNFCSMWLYGVGGIGVAVLANEFIPLAFGQNNLVVTSWTTAGGTVVSTPLAFLIGIEIYLYGQINYCRIFRNITGTFRQVKYRPIASVIVNLVVSAALVPWLGIAGCVVGTIVAYQTTYLIFDPRVICRSALQQSPRSYYLTNILYKAVTLAAGFLSWWLCSLISLGGVIGFIVRGCVCVAAPSAVFTLCYHRTEEFRFMLHTVRDLLDRYLPASGKRTKENDL